MNKKKSKKKNIIIRSMEYSYYRIYDAMSKIKSNDDPAMNALLFLMMFHNINLAYIISLQIIILNYKIEKNLLIILFILFFSIPLYIYEYRTLYKNRHEIIEYYKNETKECKRRGTIFLILYFVLTFTIAYFLSEIVKNTFSL